MKAGRQQQYAHSDDETGREECSQATAGQRCKEEVAGRSSGDAFGFRAGARGYLVRGKGWPSNREVHAQNQSGSLAEDDR